MAYLWEEYNSNMEYELAYHGFCPYTEIFQTVNNVSRVNIMYRFSKIKYLLEDCFESEETMNKIIGKKGFNTLFHLLANVDFFSGISVEDFQRMSIYDDIQKGLYGIDVYLFDKLSFSHKYKLLTYMLIKRNNEGRKNLFFDCITELFNVELDYSEFADTYIIQFRMESDYLWEGQYSAKELYLLTKELLCDFWITVEDYWHIPIGVVEEDMRIDAVQII